MRSRHRIRVIRKIGGSIDRAPICESGLVPNNNEAIGPRQNIRRALRVQGAILRINLVGKPNASDASGRHSESFAHIISDKRELTPCSMRRFRIGKIIKWCKVFNQIGRNRDILRSEHEIGERCRSAGIGSWDSTHQYAHPPTLRCIDGSPFWCWQKPTTAMDVVQAYQSHRALANRYPRNFLGTKLNVPRCKSRWLAACQEPIAYVVEHDKYAASRIGRSQGAVLSPLLSKLYLSGLDHRMSELGYEMVRYAEDVVVLCRSQEEAAAAFK